MKIKLKQLLLVNVFIAILFKIAYALPNQPTLTINDGKLTKTLITHQLLNQQTYHIKMNDSRAYLGKEIEYTAIRLCDLLKPFHLSEHNVIEFVSSDNFYALVPAKYALNCTKNHSIAYLAIESLKKPWPKLKYNNPDGKHPDAGSAGPFAIIWTNPEKDYISNEYWAWKVSRINIIDDMKKSNIIQAPHQANERIKNGYMAYASRCSGCHTMNMIGEGKIGPDLNLPINATDRFANDKTLKKFIRDPQSVRKKANDRMSGTNTQFLADNDLDDLVTYFHYMKEQRGHG